MKGYEQKVYLNNAATSWPKPDCVAPAVSQALRSLPGDAGRGGIREFDVFDQVRKKLAALLGVACPERIALGSNSTWGLNQAIFGRPGADYKGGTQCSAPAFISAGKTGDPGDLPGCG